MGHRPGVWGWCLHSASTGQGLHLESDQEHTLGSRAGFVTAWVTPGMPLKVIALWLCHLNKDRTHQGHISWCACEF